MKHTPLPWKVGRHKHINNELWLSILSGAFDITHNGAAAPGVIADSKYSAMSDEENLANAEFIVKAVNCHYELLLALQMAESALRNNNNIHHDLKEIKNAIAKAKGE